VRWQKSGSFGFAEGSALCVGQSQMCHLRGGSKLFLKNVRWKKNKKHRVGQRVWSVAVRL